MFGEGHGLLYVLGEEGLGSAFFDASELIDSSIFHEGHIEEWMQFVVFVCEMAQGGGFIEAVRFGGGELPGFSESEVLFL